MLALRTLALTLCYIRLVLIAVAACRVTVNPDTFLLVAVGAHGVDVLCRYVIGRSLRAAVGTEGELV